jgi:RNA polymerase sigma factor (sigma-70 family)
MPMGADSDDRELSGRAAAYAARRAEINALATGAFHAYGQSSVNSGVFNELLKKLYPYTHSRLLRIYDLRSLDERKEVYQEIALRFWRSANLYDKQRPFLPWWNTIVINAVRDFKKKNTNQQRYETPIGDERLIDASNDGRRHAKQIEQSAIHDNIFDRLSEYDRDILYQHYRDNVTAQELSEQLGIPIDSVRYHIRRAMGRVRALYESGRTVPSALHQNPVKGDSPDAP